MCKAYVLNERRPVMDKMKKLPDAEFDIMKVVWANDSPITTSEIMKRLGNDREWKIQTVVSFMLRLVERNFLRSEKHGKERIYFPLIKKEDYLKFETGNFIRQFHDNSFINLVNTMYEGETLTDGDIDELLNWAKERRG
jgi:predicted transcriptional regulator